MIYRHTRTHSLTHTNNYMINEIRSLEIERERERGRMGEKRLSRSVGYMYIDYIYDSLSIKKKGFISHTTQVVEMMFK